MIWTQQDTEALSVWANRNDSDDIKIKQKIIEELTHNKQILHVLHNKELERVINEKDGTTEIDVNDYISKCILPYYTIEPTQTDVQNFICFETQWEEEPNYSRNVYNYTNRKKLRQFRLQQIVFHILCHIADIKDDDTSLPRHDLLAALITRQFNWTNMFGKKIHVVSSKPSTVDNKYVARTLIFEQFTDNELVKSNDDGIPRLANKDLVFGTEDPDDIDEDNEG